MSGTMFATIDDDKMGCQSFAPHHQRIVEVIACRTTHSRVMSTALLTAVALMACGEHARRGEPARQSASSSAPSDMASSPPVDARSCAHLPDRSALKRLLKEAATRTVAGGLMGGRMAWGSVVNRAGQICATAVATDDPYAAWPGSQAIAKAKAYTANAFSTDESPLSTARLYALNQPGGSLEGLSQVNGFRGDCLVRSDNADATDGDLCGGTVTLAGGVPLYRHGRRIGGLGVSGDTSCADHEVAKTLRDLAGLNPTSGRGADDIVYAELDGASVFAHPLCLNTFRDGQKVGEARPLGALIRGDRSSTE